jgi:hypothetical protein
MVEPCFFCGEELSRASLVSHVWFTHITGLQCWCGFNCEVPVRTPSDAFRQHAASVGDLFAHYLATQFGEEC